MITNQTVFILGAGASRPYGYPSGAELRSSICREFVSRLRRAFSDEDELVAGRLAATAEIFCQVFADSNTPSIDLFLSRNVNFADVGKLAIVLKILEAERSSKFGMEIEQPREDWYSYLFERMTEDMVDPSSIGRFGDNRISFITFNYDRSLEHFLHQSLLYSFNGTADEDIDEQLNRITVRHVYGSIAALPWQGSGRGYALNYGYKEIFSLAKNVQLMHQERTSADVTEMLRNASRVFFLGFGYHKENLRALGIIGEGGFGHKQIFGTGIGLSNNKIEELKSTLGFGFSHTVSGSTIKSPVTIRKCGCRDLLSEHL